MSQLSYNQKPARGFVGQKADSRFDHVEGGLMASEAIEVGSGVVRSIAYSAAGKASFNQGKLIFDADLITSNVINLNVTGTAISAVTYASSHANTMALILAQIILDASVLTAEVDATDTNSRTIKITFIDGVLGSVTSVVVTLGASQANGVYFRGQDDNVYGANNTLRLPAANQGSLVFAGDLITSNVIDMDVNAVAISSVTFASNHLTTMGLIITELLTSDFVQAAILDSTDTDNRTIIITSVDGIDLAVTSIVVTLGSTQTTGTYTKGSHDTMYGIALQHFGLIADRTTGIVSYAINDPVNNLRQGACYVYSEVPVLNGDDVYMRFFVGGFGQKVGQFRNDADSAKAVIVPEAHFKEDTTAAGPVLLEINLP